MEKKKKSYLSKAVFGLLIAVLATHERRARCPGLGICIICAEYVIVSVIMLSTLQAA